MNRTNKISVTIITGFLGAGKTTFINSVLKKYPDTQFALVENEFGDVSIDTKLIKGLDASQMFELKQGCICCTISDEYELVLLELAERFPNVEHLLIETTGIADPACVVRPFFRNENLHSVYQFNATICLVDAVNFYSQTEKEITLKQISIADLVLLNKSENLDHNQKLKVKNEISMLNPMAEVKFSEFGFLPAFKIDLITHQQKFLPDLTTLHFSHSKIQAQTLTFHQLLDKEQFTVWLAYTLDIYKTEIYRVKGILCFESEPYEFILQGVGGSFELIESELMINVTRSVIVFIGRNIPELKFR
jgi:G3E family GTPase